MSLHSVDALLLHPDEGRTLSRLTSAEASTYLASLWVAKEAIVKSTGDGLRVDLTQLFIRVNGTAGDVQTWPRALAITSPPQVGFFSVTADVIGAVATQ